MNWNLDCLYCILHFEAYFMLIEEHSGMSSEQLTEKTQNIDETRRMAVINRLLSCGRLEMRKSGPNNTDIILKLRNLENMEKIKGWESMSL